MSAQSPSSRVITVPRDAANANDRARAIVARLEAIMAPMIDVLAAEGAEGDALVMPYRRSRDPPERPTGTLTFPGKTLHEATKFSQLMHIMHLSREALLAGRIITKRNIYYQNIDLFKTQKVVDHLVDDLACTLEIGRTALNIVAAAKGLVSGPLRLIMADGSVVSCASNNDASNSIPPIRNIHQVDFGATQWILVIEKEATFRTLAACQYWKHCPRGEGILVTGKGYADLATLEFLNLVHTLRPSIPILCVVDCDPHGIDIMRTYKHGSRTLGHEANTRIPALQWLGVKMHDICSAANRLCVASDDHGSQGSDSQSSQSSQSSERAFSQGSSTSASSSTRSRAQRTPLDSLVQLTLRDRKTTLRIMESIVDDGDAEVDVEDLEQIREMQVMMMFNKKAEIQAVDDMGDLSGWLDEKMTSGLSMGM